MLYCASRQWRSAERDRAVGTQWWDAVEGHSGEIQWDAVDGQSEETEWWDAVCSV